MNFQRRLEQGIASIKARTLVRARSYSRWQGLLTMTTRYLKISDDRSSPSGLDANLCFASRQQTFYAGRSQAALGSALTQSPEP